MDRSQISQVVVALLIGIPTAAISAWLTARLTLRRFYSERWWERKAEAYADIIESLFFMKRYADDWLASYEEQRYSSSERKAELDEQHRQGRANVEKAAAIGAFIISEDAASVLSRLQRDLDIARSQEDPYDIAGSQQKALDRAIPAIRKIAKTDLGV